MIGVKMSHNHDFFEETREQSRVKSQIVSKYFKAWSTIISDRVHPDRIAYLDLYCGPGYYKDGTASTPILILQDAIAEPRLHNKLVTIFNDQCSEHIQALQYAIHNLPGITSLKYPPQTHVGEIDAEIAAIFNKTHLVPALVFIDPCGYKGMTLDLINAVIKDKCCECIFFFNYNRINAAINNDFVRFHMDGIFGTERVEALRTAFKDPRMQPADREKMILQGLVSALTERHGKHVLPFRFVDESGSRTSHYLVFVTKHPLGYKVMKDIMAHESLPKGQEVPSYEFNPAKCMAQAREKAIGQFSMLDLLGLEDPIADLANSLCRSFAGQKVTMQTIFAKHNIGTPYIEKNYRAALLRLESEGRIVTDPPAHKRHRNTFSKQVVVEFPNRGHD